MGESRARDRYIKGIELRLARPEERICRGEANPCQRKLDKVKESDYILLGGDRHAATWGTYRSCVAVFAV
jgi:hypothetical protein